MSDTDLELLERYTRLHAEEAFAEIVRRHLGLVFSAAVRQVRSPQLAEEVAQSVFTDLARNAARLKRNTILSAWLYQVTHRTAVDVVRRETSRQSRERVATEINLMNATDADWAHIEPLLDEAMHALEETDRAAVLLRYFENKSLREVGAAFGASENAAQKRLTRAIERLREFFAKRGVTVGASGLAMVISANALQAAPAGLAGTVTGPALAGTAAMAGSAFTQWFSVVGVKIGIVSLLVIGLSSWVVFKMAKPHDAGTSRRLSTLSYNELLNLGHSYGRDGDWRKAFACFREVIARGSTNESDLLWATGAAVAAGEHRACEAFCRRALANSAEQDNPTAAERFAKLCLVLPNLPHDLLTNATERADFAILSDASSRWRQLAKGMAEYRRGNWDEALQWLSMPASSAQWEISIQAMAFGAMARHRLGDSSGARDTLNELNRQLMLIVRMGELCPTRIHTWDNFARASAVRTEAERLISPKSISPTTNPALVRNNRIEWQQVIPLIDSADAFARQGAWPEARDAYVQAIKQAVFDWQVWEMKQDILVQKMAAVFLLANDPVQYRELCRNILKLSTMTPVMKERYASVCLSGFDFLPDDVKAQALAQARDASASPDSNPRLLFVRGVAACREHQYAECAAVLERVRFPGDDVARARALIFQAIAFQKSGQAQEAEARVIQAEAAFSRGVRNAGWWNVGFYQLAMRELQAMASARNTAENRP